MKTQAFEKGVGRGARGKGCHPSSGKFSGSWLLGLGWVIPCPQQERDTLEQASAPPASRNPYLPRGGGGSSHQGAPGATGRYRPSGPFSASPVSRTQRPISRPRGLERTPPRRRREAVEKNPPTQGGRVALKSLLTHLLKKASRRLSPQRHLQGRGSLQGWTAVPSARGTPSLCPNFRQEAPSPWAHNDARTPAALRGQCQASGCHQAPGPRPRVPPAVAGSGAERGLQPLGVPAAARAAPSPTARARRPPALRPAEAGGRRGVAAEGKQG